MADPRQAAWSIGLVAGACLAGGITLVLVLLLGDGAPQPAPAGLPDAGLAVGWLRAVLPLPTTVAAMATVGFSLLGGGYLASDRAARDDAFSITVEAALAWLTLALLGVALAAIELRAEASRWASDPFGTLAGSVEVRGLTAQVVLAGSAAGIALLGTGRWRARAVLPLALVGLLPTVLTGHVQTADSPLLASTALVLHVVAAGLWTGGLLALAWLVLRHRPAWIVALPRYSSLALGCVIALATSGAVAALGRIDLDQLLTTAYGAVVTLKAVVLLALAGLGMLQRRHVVARGAVAVSDFVLLAGSELTLMMLAFALATGLAQTPPPG